MANNVFVKIPERGDACVGRLSDKKLFYIKADTLVTSELDKSEWEVQGVVFHREGKKVTIVGLNNSGNIAFCDRVWYYLSGYTLDGAEHTIVLAIPTKADWNKSVEKTITYMANTVEEFIDALNTAFAADADFTDQDWYADLMADGRVRVHYVFAIFNNNDFTVKSGIIKTQSFPECIYFYKFTRKSGYVNGMGAIAFWFRALKYYREDNGYGQAQGGLTTEQSNPKQQFPINLPTWNATSAKNPGDFCKALRDVYGAGEAGWLRFMRSCMPVSNTDNGAMCGDGIKLGKQIASLTYTSRKVAEPKYMCPASGWCGSYSTSCLPAGSWYLPAPKELFSIFRGVALRDEPQDILSKTLAAVGGQKLNLGDSYHSCVKGSSDRDFAINYNFGIFYILRMYDKNGKALAISQQTLKFD